MARFYDIDGNQLRQQDVEDIPIWAGIGHDRMEEFVDLYGQALNLRLNPDRENNPALPELINEITGAYCILHTENTPFFKARELFNTDPQITVVFNVDDANQIHRNRLNIDIYFWVNWIAVRMVQLGGAEYAVNPLNGVWKINSSDLLNISTSAPVHQYRNRINDQRGNSRNSFVLTLDSPGFIRVIGR